MDNDKFQELVLAQLSSLGDRMGRLETRQEHFEVGQQEMRSDIQVGQQDMRSDIQLLQVGQQDMRSDIQLLQVGQQQIWTSIETLALSQEQMKEDIQTMKSDIDIIRQSQARVEHDLSGKVKALFDFRESQIETNRHVAARLDRLEVK